MKNSRTCLFLLIVFITQVQSQTLFTIDKVPVSVEEFKRVYTKNNINNQADYSRASLQEYLSLFINFKLKVTEAEALQLDTNKAIKSELEGYKKQLIESYVNDKEVSEKLVKEAYNRSQEEVDVSHILVKWTNTFPSKMDSNLTLNKAKEIQKELTNTNFPDKAVKYSDDPSAKSNKGRLGYLTVFQTVYPFENAMYNTEVGNISNPTATRFGYHLVLVHDKRSAKGKIKTAHILIKKVSKDKMKVEDPKVLAEKIYQEILSGTITFNQAVEKYSEDYKSKYQNGMLPELSESEMLPSYAYAAFSLEEDGDISKPIETSIGWHIIKRVHKSTWGTYEDSKSKISSLVKRDSRSNMALEQSIEETKNNFGYKQNDEAIDKLIASLSKSYNGSSFNIKAPNTYTKSLFSIGKKSYNESDFIAYANQKTLRVSNKETVFAKLYEGFDDFTNQKIIEYKKEHLEEVNEDYAHLLQEYHDGILLFELTDREVWKKSSSDTTGLEQFYEQNKNKYQWKKRLDYSKFILNNSKHRSKVLAWLEKGKTQDFILKKLNKKDTVVLVENHKLEEGQENISKLLWKENTIVANKLDDGKEEIFYVNKILPPQAKKLSEARGYVISDYQNYLEERWIHQLKQKYKVDINDTLFESLIKK